MVTNRNKMYFEFEQKMKFFPIFSLKDIEIFFPSFDRKALVYWQKKGYITKIRNGFYCFSKKQYDENFLYYTANKIYSPSYISFESALSYYGIIPEGVFVQLSASTIKTNSFDTPFGKFSYKKIKSSLFFGYKIINLGNLSFKIAELEKSILDILYLNDSLNSIDSFDALRWNKEEVKKMNFNTFENYQTLFNSKALNHRIDHLIKYIYA